MATPTRGAKLAEELRRMQRQQSPAPPLSDSDDTSASSEGPDDYDEEAFQRLAHRIMNRMHQTPRHFASPLNLPRRL